MQFYVHARHLTTNQGVGGSNPPQRRCAAPDIGSPAWPSFQLEHINRSALCGDAQAQGLFIRGGWKGVQRVR